MAQGLAELLRLPENGRCADCTAQSPNWASWNLGVFICDQCAAVHRSLGPLVSNPRSVASQDWNAEQVATLKAIGNLTAECFWEHSVPFGEERPEVTDPREFVQQWIRRKYQRMEFQMQPNNTLAVDPGVREYETEGYLLKESGGSGVGKWQQRYFIVKDYKLEYYESKPMVGFKAVPKNIVSITPKTRISVRVCSGSALISAVAVSNRSCCLCQVSKQFGIVDPAGPVPDILEVGTEGRTFFIQAAPPASPAYICDWIRALRGVRAYSRNLEVQTAQATKMSGNPLG
jgi:hypothetical protein